MPSVKRDRLLSDLERERLMKRGSLDRHTRTTNDVRVKRKLAAWLKSSQDIKVMLRYLPKDDIQEVADDIDIFRLLTVATDLFYAIGFRPIEGTADHPEDWKAVIDKDNKEPATDLDVARCYTLLTQLEDLTALIGGTIIERRSPMAMMNFFWMLEDHEEFQDRLTDNERKAIERVRQACMKYKDGELK